ncbi:methylthioribose-1-phosphate isomerase [[Candida] jaroonii]|uniref:Methylthioribose-1-phosphate isomerase n=1 Tax=[Candida] jaroonii TaxID=467808 RepID=A0ACA9Y5D4_9ASCO|nr:methylthioribose-1-phosphate isomerase [[Candida] jaroonii]
MNQTLEAIKFDRSNVSLEILDQLLLPYQTHYIDISNIEDAYDAIKKMQVRGAPAIAIVGSFSIAVDVTHNLKGKSVDHLIERINYLITSRPTAVNLSNACNEILDLITPYKAATIDETIESKIFDYAVKLYDDDLANNKTIGENGLNFIIESLKQENFKGSFSIMTICNTGSLATSGHGTALGIIRSVYQKLNESNTKEEFFLDHVYPCETRPYNQGAKLTTYELNYEKIPFTLICDNMASSLINNLNSPSPVSVKENKSPVKFIIVGADRVVANGDTANKIGTFQLSTIASFFNSTGSHQKIKFLVAAPLTTVDYNTSTGEDIVIEERPSHELTTLKGPIVDNDQVGDKVVVGIATPGIQVWNPAFDVTPHSLIDGIVTELPKVFVKENGKFTLN